jgi:transposase
VLWIAPGYHIKKGLIATERDRPALRQARREWITRRQPRMRQEPHRLVFIDETAVKTNLTRLRGRAPVGERLYGTAPFGKWATQTFIAGLTQNALIAPWVITGAMNGPAFDTYVETQLAPALDPGTVVILDNLSTHKSTRAAEVLRRHGSWFLFLPPYSPDLNPIEMAFSKLKAHLRRIGARTFDALFEALGDICDLFDPKECWNFIKAAGYASD